ncbi:MAG TPA: hypothetical protein VHF06_21535 [Pseudonocardiaceae bacterium]|nr:hypothetical protein [Pseudonocardiaceae bacterium]
MADDVESTRPASRRRRRRVRQAVLAEVRRSFFDDDNPGDDGSAGVREPRRPKPTGPVSGAGALPEPQPPLIAVLPDPRS